ncbi:MAG TPA: CPBP family intramembrane glutamic endopeptidase [Gemmataceae bacterium]|nr:CPBP family intramembrane glutamic endopeptidase [Gemmataceae bacterium]
MRRDWYPLLFAMVFPTLMAWCYFVALARPAEGHSPAASVGRNPTVVAAWVAGKAVQFAFPVVWLGVVERRRLRPASPSFTGVVFGLGFGGVVALGTLGLYYGLLRNSPLLAGTPARIHEKVVEFGLENQAVFVLFVAFLAAGHSLLEEYYWRWFVFGGLRKHLPPAAAIAVSSLAFMAYHVIDLAAFFPGKFWAMAVPLSICVAVGGAVWAWLYERTGSIYAPWLSHLLIDAAIMTVGFDLAFIHPR